MKAAAATRERRLHSLPLKAEDAMEIQDYRDIGGDDVDDPRRHTLGGFRPGRGFGSAEIDEDETLSIEFETDETASQENPSGDLSAGNPAR